ncbi:MAG: S-layer homology domain-containing protein [Oscillospiraceae bacterium]
MKRKICALLLVFCTAASIMSMPASAFEFKSFPDVKESDWFYECVGWLSALEIINGYPNGYFRPNDPIKRSEFIKMVAVATELQESTTPLRNIHWSEEYWLMACENGILEFNDNNVVALNASSLEQYITRYEMAVMVSNAMDGVMMEDTVEITKPSTAITDYSTISKSFRPFVEQAYGKGVLTGFTDGSFLGNQKLTRAEAAMAIYRLLWSNERVKPTFDYTIIEREDPTAPSVIPTDTPFAIWVQNNGLLNAYGKPSDALKQLLFGSTYKSYFTSATDAGDYITNVEIPIWRINSSGVKYSTTAWVQVHKLVAQDVYNIFVEIYNDPEKFPINSVGGARYSDTLRHSWGCAIDINPTQNAYGYYSNGILQCSVGNGWWPGTSSYSITSGGSVVRAFKKYGWGWGGQGYRSGWYDYMHFSIMPSGG